jgi:DNA-binding NarL/FixJ family response regulator
MPAEPIRILVVDDHAVVRQGLESMLSQFDDLTIVGTASSGEEGLAAAEALSPDIVLLDLQMPGMQGLEVLTRFTEKDPETPKVVVLTMHDDDETVLKAVRGGAKGYVLKHASQEELAAAIRHVAAGGTRFDEVVVSAFLKESQREAERSLLSARDIEILRLVASGCSNKEVARRLYLSVGTIKTHLDDIYRALEVSDRAHAVAVALRKGLLDEPSD